MRINILEANDTEEEEEFLNFGETIKFDISKYVGLYDEPISFMFRPSQAQLAANKDIPLIVKLDGELTVRLSSSELTSNSKFDDNEDEMREQ